MPPEAYSGGSYGKRGPPTTPRHPHPHVLPPRPVIPCGAGPPGAGPLHAMLGRGHRDRNPRVPPRSRPALGGKRGRRTGGSAQGSGRRLALRRCGLLCYRHLPQLEQQLRIAAHGFGPANAANDIERFSEPLERSARAECSHKLPHGSRYPLLLWLRLLRLVRANKLTGGVDIGS